VLGLRSAGVSGPSRSISRSPAAPVARLTWSDALGKRIREGDWAEQAVSTYTKVGEAIAAGQWELAAQLVDYTMEEAKVVYVIYQVWSEGFLDWLRAEGVPEDELAAELGRLRGVLAFPDGEPFDPTSRWEALAAAAGLLANRLRVFEIEADEAVATTRDLRERWRQLHDRGADFQAGLLTFVARRFGEPRLEDCYRHVLEPYLQERYRPFDTREQPYEATVYRNLYLAFEAMRGHLCGPGREGNLEVVEHDDRVVLRFDPCGSGGRMQRGDAIEGTPPRTEPPYAFGVTQAEYDWAWNEKGVCYYCAHCCFALERWPAEHWGHPVRVVDSPLYPDETTGERPKKCTWTIYRSLEAIPPEAYERIGLRKPSA
jgi:hypothetical protein